MIINYDFLFDTGDVMIMMMMIIVMMITIVKIKIAMIINYEDNHIL